jgi:hypothetical protein
MYFIAERLLLNYVQNRLPRQLVTDTPHLSFSISCLLVAYSIVSLSLLFTWLHPPFYYLPPLYLFITYIFHLLYHPLSVVLPHPTESKCITYIFHSITYLLLLVFLSMIGMLYTAVIQLFNRTQLRYSYL